MAVVCESAAGWLLDELALVNKWYEAGGGLGGGAPPLLHNEQDTKDTKASYKLREDFFRLYKPYFTLQPAPAPAETCAPQSDSALSRCPRVRKKRKRPIAYNQGELDALEYHKAINDLISEGSRLLIQEGFNKGLLHSPSGSEEQESKIVSKLYGNKKNLADLCDMSKDMPLVSLPEYAVKVLDTESPFSHDGDYLLHITENASDFPQIIHIMGEQYLIPPKSNFLLSDISYMDPLLHYKKYGIIVIDPPWENKSVKRSKRYNSLSPSKIKELPIPAMAAPDCLVITWVTNRQKHLRFVKEELYPHWSIRSLAEWHWVKITQSGEFVFPIDSVHKKPYEILVLGRLMHLDNSTSRELETSLPPIPEHKIIVSVPCSLHSHKPPLSAERRLIFVLPHHCLLLLCFLCLTQRF
ncbi:N(6)-adenine-specific methyltransferase METTL4 isoform X2 [Hyla sarda]|uniref:N(6)-adenine-specific methyltransferase METTL4 isoform X2 n=1 Tax=Hyla sarda TaxID=327740 RepID=UPI0024C306A6|nr:N(6)-adenine-specific methyltransferase METTL4 isoform X2 [Hyla sarda]